MRSISCGYRLEDFCQGKNQYLIGASSVTAWHLPPPGKAFLRAQASLFGVLNFEILLFTPPSVNFKTVENTIVFHYEWEFYYTQNNITLSSWAERKRSRRISRSVRHVDFDVNVIYLIFSLVYIDIIYSRLFCWPASRDPSASLTLRSGWQRSLVLG